MAFLRIQFSICFTFVSLYVIKDEPMSEEKRLPFAGQLCRLLSIKQNTLLGSQKSKYLSYLASDACQISGATSARSSPNRSRQQPVRPHHIVGACNLTLHIHVVVSLQLSPNARTQVSTHRGYVLRKSTADILLVFNRSQAQLQVDFFAMITSFLF